MSAPASAMPVSFEQRGSGRGAVTRPFLWSVRRELCEHRSVYIAPLASAGVILLAFFLALGLLPRHVRAAMALDAAHYRAALAPPFDFAAGLIMGAALLVSIFYSLDALYGERRDRSILFWKSLPVSDLTAVLAKASIPLLVLPVFAFVIAFATETIMLLLSSAVLLGNGLSVAMFWERLQLYQTMFMLLYHLVTVHMLWYAPLYAWLLLISAWARRAPFLWAALPPLAIYIFEKIAFHTSYFANFLGERVGGGGEAVDNMKGNFPIHPGMHLTPGIFLATPGLWLGLLFAAACLVGAARLRRYRQPN